MWLHQKWNKNNSKVDSQMRLSYLNILIIFVSLVLLVLLDLLEIRKTSMTHWLTPLNQEMQEHLCNKNNNQKCTRPRSAAAPRSPPHCRRSPWNLGMETFEAAGPGFAAKSATKLPFLAPCLTGSEVDDDVAEKDCVWDDVEDDPDVTILGSGRGST